MPPIDARRGRGSVKDFFNKIAKAASVYLDPYGENELKRMELADQKLDLENSKINKPFDFGDVPNKQNLNIFAHELNHAIDHPADRLQKLQDSLKKFNTPKPASNIGILPPDNEPAVAPPPEVTPAQHASQVATVMAGGTQTELRAPRTAKFRKHPAAGVRS
jgi:hypothetical protein